jgi:hypothetical protein
MDSVDKNTDIFWLNEPTILARTYLQFIPTKNMSNNQRYNAITLFAIYFMVLLLVFQKPIYLIYFPLIVIIIILVLHFIEKQKMKKNEQFDSIVESGYVDSNNNLRFSRVTGGETDGPDVSYSCRLPTADNPFMNPPISDFNTVAPAACNSDDENIQNLTTKSFRHNLYMDVDDVFSKMNSQRQFYTVPNTAIPNNQGDFANWLYRTPTTCKEDQEQCLRYEDLRFKR